MKEFFDSIVNGMHWYCEMDDAGREMVRKHTALFDPGYIRNLAPEIADMLGRPEGVRFPESSYVLFIAWVSNPDNTPNWKWTGTGWIIAKR